MQFRSARGNHVVLLLAMIKGVYPVGHRNERRKVSGIVTVRIGMHVFTARPPERQPGRTIVEFQRVEWFDGWKSSAIF